MVKKVKTKELEPGMIVAKDVYTPFDELVVSRNTVLTDRGIAVLDSYHVTETFIRINEDKEEDLRQEFLVQETTTYYCSALERMKQSEGFKQFHKAFQESLMVSKKIMDDIVFRGAEVNCRLIDITIDHVIRVSNNGIFIFDMLHCMRELDDLTYAHSMSVAIICKVFGEWLHMSKEDVEVLVLAGFFHDIGKVKVPKEIIYKKEALSKSEYDIVKKHSEFGYEILRNKKIDERIIMTALMHHERCDGTGYPNRLKRDQIDEFAKIVAIADAYEAMTARRCYREELCPFKVIEEFEKNALSHYEPKYILPLMEMIVQSYIGNDVKLNNGVIGKVILINKHSLARPVIQTKTDYIDLSKDKTLKIESVV